MLLAVGQVLYGSLMGGGDPLAMLAGGADTVARWSTHFENNYFRGLLFKIGAGFRLQGDTTNYVLDPRLFPVLNVLAYAFAAALVGYLLLAASAGTRPRLDCSPLDRVQPGHRDDVVSVAAHRQDYLVSALPGSGRVVIPWLHQLPRAWSLPGGGWRGRDAADRRDRADEPVRAWLPITTSYPHATTYQNTLFADQIGSGIGVYEFFGFPGLGLLLGWVLLVRLERQSRAR